MCAHDTVFYDQALVDQKENCPSVSLFNDICDMHFSPFSFFLQTCKFPHKKNTKCSDMERPRTGLKALQYCEQIYE